MLPGRCPKPAPAASAITKPSWSALGIQAYSTPDPASVMGRRTMSSAMDVEGRMSRTERRLDATLKIVQTGMKLLVKMQQDSRESKKEMREFKKEMLDFKDEMREFKDEIREFKEETRRGINALIAAQMRSDARVDRLVAALRMRSNGHSN